MHIVFLFLPCFTPVGNTINSYYTKQLLLMLIAMHTRIQSAKIYNFDEITLPIEKYDIFQAGARFYYMYSVIHHTSTAQCKWGLFWVYLFIYLWKSISVNCIL